MSGMLHGGKGNPRPLRGNKPTSLNEARNEMRRLMGVLMAMNRKYLEREAHVTQLHAKGLQNFSGELVTVLSNDLLLANYSGASRICADLVQGLSAYIQAEIAMKKWRREDPHAAEAFEQMATEAHK